MEIKWNGLNVIGVLGAAAAAIYGVWYAGYSRGFEEAKLKMSNLIMQKWIEAHPDEEKEEIEKSEEEAK